MRKLIIVCSLFSVGISLAQRSEILSKIDSISQSKWQKIYINKDSIANPVWEKVALKPKDTLAKVDEMRDFLPKQEEIPVTPFALMRTHTEKRWFFLGQNHLHFNQATFSNWNAGGNNNLGVLAKVNYNISYKRDRHYLENIIQLGYGLVMAEGQGTRKTEDYLNIATNYGYDLGKNYYLSAGYQLVSQFTAGYNYASTPEPTYSDRISKFMAPAYLNVGLGISYNPMENFHVIFRPANGKFTFVLDKKLQQKGRYGLERDGQTMRMELGAMLNILYRWKIYKDINFVNQLNFFTNYLHHTERVDVNYSGVLNMRFNKFITAMIGIDLLYDHDQMLRTQLKQTLGIGFTYNIGTDNLPKNTNTKSIKPFVK
ncbi:MAG: DUF3078 domain-containing protein [Bergeyella zoohelcum]|nr:DUF3078 domain-containing protein [Bergeyella zoohelcum]